MKFIILTFLYFTTTLCLAEDKPIEDIYISKTMVLTIIKSELIARLEILDGQSNPELIKTYKIGLGQKQGDKWNQGDLRTPEGVYTTIDIIQEKDLDDIYGEGAITLTYPNPVDIEIGKTGGGIWLHGVDNEDRVDKKLVSRGCVIFHNKDITELMLLMNKKNSFVRIIPDSGYDKTYTKMTQKVLKRVQIWANSWDKRDLDTYLHFYDRPSNAFKRKKRNVFGQYKKFSVKISNIKIIPHEKYVVVSMDQKVITDNFTSSGIKTLYWRNNNGFKIIKEVFAKKNIKDVN